jgi:hypothetical protein
LHYDHEGGHIDPCEQEKRLYFLAHRALIDWARWHDTQDSHHEKAEIADKVVSKLPARHRAVLVEEYLRGPKRRPSQVRRAAYMRLSRWEYRQILETAKFMFMERLAGYMQLAERHERLSKRLNGEQNRAQQAEVA